MCALGYAVERLVVLGVSVAAGDSAIPRNARVWLARVGSNVSTHRFGCPSSPGDGEPACENAARAPPAKRSDPRVNEATSFILGLSGRDGRPLSLCPCALPSAERDVDRVIR